MKEGVSKLNIRALELGHTPAIITRQSRAALTRLDRRSSTQLRKNGSSSVSPSPMNSVPVRLARDVENFSKALTLSRQSAFSGLPARLLTSMAALDRPEEDAIARFALRAAKQGMGEATYRRNEAALARKSDTAR